MTLPRYLPQRTAADYLGISLRTLKRWQADATLAGRDLLRPTRRIHGTPYHDRARLDAFMQTGKASA